LNKAQHITSGRLFLVIFPVILWCGSVQLYAQLSPGELYKGHADLEGMFNCTQCHSLGKKIDENKCLACHELLQSRINQNLGYHVSEEVKNKACITCHSDHHGRNFDITRFDVNAFNHYKTGYELEGAHVEQDCKACHKPENISDPEVLNKSFTYLGLDTKCLSCHDDFHQGSLSEDCASCHSFDAFAPANNFDHSDTRFPLKGKHEAVDCRLCHKESESAGSLGISIFEGIPFASCTSCHDDEHKGRFGSSCTQCHTEDSFQTFIGDGRFNHNVTSFPLKGKHKSVSCVACHTQGTHSSTPFNEYNELKDYACTECHQDVHEGKFGNQCTECHSENAWKVGDDMDGFDHNLTAFPLEGLHKTVDCRSCHTTNLVDPLPFNTCTACHDDAHSNQLMVGDDIRDCGDCHRVSGFENSTFDIVQHNDGPFPLNGAHLATPCISCHMIQDEWRFKDIGITCVDCHEDIHARVLDSQFYPDNDCTACHSENRWTDVTFDHSSTTFKLEGAHMEVDCRGCHFEEVGTDFVQQFTGLSHDCSSCHMDNHGGQFTRDGLTNCKECHNASTWLIDSFDHNKTQFPLDGAHINVDCMECHKETRVNNESYILYKIENFRCIDCHL
jgi:hypothetical protein